MLLALDFRRAGLHDKLVSKRLTLKTRYNLLKKRWDSVGKLIRDDVYGIKKYFVCWVRQLAQK